jgi:hypothetical protein
MKPKKHGRLVLGVEMLSSTMRSCSPPWCFAVVGGLILVALNGECCLYFCTAFSWTNALKEECEFRIISKYFSEWFEKVVCLTLLWIEWLKNSAASEWNMLIQPLSWNEYLKRNNYLYASSIRSVLKTLLFVGAFLCCEKVFIFLLESSITIWRA